MLKQIVVSIFTLSLTVSTSFAAENFECKHYGAPGAHGSWRGGTVGMGAIKGEIISKCGQPDIADVIKYKTVNGRKVPTLEILYFYPIKGINGDKNMKFTLEKGKLTKIEKIK